MEQNITIGGGLLTALGVITLWKLLRLRFRTNSKPLSFMFWVANNWLDYPIHLGITVIFFFYEQDMLDIINPLLARNGIWQIPYPKNKGFIFVMVPIVISLVIYPLLRRVFIKQAHKAISPQIHNEFCGSEDIN